MCNKPKKSRPTRKTRTRTRKPKFLSLLCLDAGKKTPISDQLSEKSKLYGSMSENSQLSGESTHPQLTLFPLHPENHHDDQNENMAYTLFSSSDDNSAATLSGLLNTAKIEPFSTSETDSPINCAYSGHDNDTDGVLLVRTALRNRERDASEEVKWVCFSGAAGSDRVKTRPNGNGNGGLKLDLKLDYEGILNAWSDKGEIFLERECCSGDDRSVPDLSCDDLLFNLDPGGANVLMDGLWRVPEKSMVEDKLDDEKWKIGQSREASVLRYKEKRQSRLFSKQIRYQVRKLNAEKRPRIKGRFVKRS